MTSSFKLSEKLTPQWAIVLALTSLALGANAVVAGKVSDRGAGMPTVEQDFQFHCAACHGPDGKGGGPVSRVLKIEPPDLTRIAERNGGVFPEAKIIGSISGLNMPISHGTREMPVWGDQFVGETLEGSVSVEDAQEAVSDVTDRIERLVGYIGTIQVIK